MTKIQSEGRNVELRSGSYQRQDDITIDILWGNRKIPFEPPGEINPDPDMDIVDYFQISEAESLKNLI